MFFKGFIFLDQTWKALSYPITLLALTHLGVAAFAKDQTWKALPYPIALLALTQLGVAAFAKDQTNFVKF